MHHLFGLLYSSQLLALALCLATYTLLSIPFWEKGDVEIYHAAFSARLRVAQRNVTLAAHLKSNMSSLTQRGVSFRPLRWFSGKWLRMPDQGLISLDFYPSFTDRPLREDECFVVVIPGLTGGSEHAYITAFSESICLGRSPVDIRCVVCNYRGCSETPLVTPKLYHGGRTQDLRCAILYLTTTFPGHKLFGIGFSLGANVLVKYAGEEGKRCPLSGIISLGNIWDYVQVAKHLDSGTWLNRFFYKYQLGHAIRELVKGHSYMYGLPVLSEGKIRTRLRSASMSVLMRTRFVPFELCVANFLCPLFGFASSQDYYARTSSMRYIDKVAIPCLAINSRDDPLVPSQCLPYCQALASPWFILATTRYGGHIGWVEEDGSRWYIKPILEFIEALFQMTIMGIFKWYGMEY
ncbi:AB-hydrolase YheT [Neolentinus lepideus HHB14362 ss-1]|uniref:AB-hydrolase YheT n=1 Tax=Neolentinus lepideus HHB14362 ss-1 TaxID=1314782 RepID=A0A165RQB6_9AGAM|nr:AB-hydrolase YheT [Neolentinus lepideus HHB14362 ss-1]